MTTRRGLLLGLTALALLGPLSGSQAQAFQFLTQWGGSGTGMGTFAFNDGLAITANGDLLVADLNNKLIQEFTPSGTFVQQWSGQAPDPLIKPVSVAVDSNQYMYVLDQGYDSVLVYKPDGTYLGGFGGHGSGNGKLSTPADIAVAPSGDILVADNGNDLIQEFTNNGMFVRQWGGPGTGNGTFNGPSGVATDAAGNVYVADLNNNLVQKFDSTGHFNTQWGGFGPGNGKFKFPNGVTTDSAGNVYVSDYQNDLIQKFDSSGTFLSQFGGMGTGNGKFQGPYDLASDCRGNLYVTDPNNFLVQKFGEPGLPDPPCIVKPSNSFTIGKFSRNRRRGSGRLAVDIPSAGLISLSGSGVVPIRHMRGGATSSSAVADGPHLALLVVAKGKKRKQLRRKGKVTLALTVTYTPTGGDPASRQTTVKLIRNKPRPKNRAGA